MGLSTFSAGLFFSNTFFRAPISFLGSSTFFYMGADCLVFLVSVGFAPPPPNIDGIANFSILPYSIFFSTFYSTSSFTTLLNLLTYSVVLAAPNLGLSSFLGSAGLFFSNMFLREPTSYCLVSVMLLRATGSFFVVSFFAPKGFLLTLYLVLVDWVSLVSEIFFSNMAVNLETSFPYILFKILGIKNFIEL